MKFFSKNKISDAIDKAAQMKQDNIERDRNLFEAMQVLSPDLLFRLDLLTNRMEMFGKTCEDYHLPKVLEDFPAAAFPHIEAEDAEALGKAVQDMKQGLQTACCIRLRAKDGQLRWHTHQYVLRYNDAGTPVEALGKLTDVHEQKELENQITRDGLTGCLRKKTFERLCISYMIDNPKSGHALLIIDIDNFKAINDNLGHYFGDMVLCETGDRLKKMFRANDYIGRVGGDEFMVFMRDVDDWSLVEQKACDIVKAMDVTYEGKNQSYRITGSVGVAMSPKDGDDFFALYKNADIALYDVKNRGKNGYLRYHPALSKGTMENTTPFDVALRSLSQHFNAALIADVFDLLFESKVLDISISRALQRMGRQFGVSRCYVFEQSKETADAYTNTYEWCAAGVTPEIDNLQVLPRALVQPFFDSANEAGILYCNDLSALKDEDAYALMDEQGVQSFLHAYTYQSKHVSYVLGFDECTGPRVWSPMEVSTIMYLSRIVAQFLNYKNALEAANVVSEERLAVLDSLNYFAYIIDPDTHKLSYYNKAVQAMLPDLKTGDICYMHLRGNSAECADCPLKAMRASKETTAREVIYNRKLDMHVLVNAVWLPQFDGKEAIFVSSNDISDIIDPACASTQLPNE